MGVDAGELGDKFRTYVVLETSWWVTVYAVCYRWQPTILLMRTGWGSTAVRRAGAWLQRAWPSRYDGIAKAANRVYDSPNGRTFAEWALINKVLAPVSFPAKLALANRIVNQRAALAASGAAIIALEAAKTEKTSEPDLVPDQDPAADPVQTIVRSVSAQVQTATTATLRGER